MFTFFDGFYFANLSVFYSKPTLLMRDVTCSGLWPPQMIKNYHISLFSVGCVIEKGVRCLPYAGQQVTEYLGKLLTESGYR